MQLNFGSGSLWATQMVDATGAAVANPTPVQFGALQDVSVEFSFDIKKLFGKGKYAIDAAQGKGNIMLKPKFAMVNGLLLNQHFFGQTLTSALVADYEDQTGAAIPGTPYQITPTVPGSGTWSADLGVKDANGLPLTRVASAPTAGQYSVAAGVYTFAAADTGKTVYTSFQYTGASTGAKKIALGNPNMGAAPMFRTDVYLPYKGKALVLTLNNCISGKLSMASKMDDYTIPEMDIEAIADANNNVGYLGLSE